MSIWQSTEMPKIWIIIQFACMFFLIPFEGVKFLCFLCIFFLTYDQLLDQSFPCLLNLAIICRSLFANLWSAIRSISPLSPKISYSMQKSVSHAHTLYVWFLVLQYQTPYADLLLFLSAGVILASFLLTLGYIQIWLDLV